MGVPGATVERGAARLGAALPWVVVGAACVLRWWGMDHGLPFPNARPDEREALGYTAGFPAGDLNPHWFVYPNLYFYLLWLWEELALGVRRLSTETPDYATMLATDLAALLRHGRVLAVLVGAATVAALYAIGRRTGGRALGLVAAALLAVNLLHVRDSQTFKAEVFVTAGVLASVWCLARWVETRGRREALVAGAAIGLTTGLKYNGLLLLVPAWVAGVLGSPRAGLRRLVPDSGQVLLAATALATFLLTSPYLVLDPQLTLHTAGFATRNTFIDSQPRRRPAATTWERIARLGADRSFGYHLAVSLRRGAGLLFALATPFALALAFRRPREPLLVLAAGFVLLYYLVIGASPVSLVRYLSPVVPLLALVVAHLVVRLSARATGPGPARAALTAGLTLALAVEPAASTIAHDRIAARTDTRVLATAWMAAHLPPGAVVAVLGSTYFPIADPELPPGVERAPLPLASTDLDRWRTTHVVTHEHELRFSKLHAGQMRVLGPRLRRLAEFSPYRAGPAGTFEWWDAFYIPIAGFDGVTRPGPLVRIYALEPAPAGAR